MRRFLATNICHTKAIITYFVGVFVALGIQHAMRMHRIILPYAAWPAVQNVSTLSHKWHDFRKKYIKCVLLFIIQHLSEIFSCHKKKWTRYYHKCLLVFTLSIRYFLSDFNETWVFLTGFRRILKYKIQENPPSGSRFVPCGQTDRGTEGQADMTKLKDAFHTFVNASKNSHNYHVVYFNF